MWSSNIRLSCHEEASGYLGFEPTLMANTCICRCCIAFANWRAATSTCVYCWTRSSFLKKPSDQSQNVWLELMYDFDIGVEKQASNYCSLYLNPLLAVNPCANTLDFKQTELVHFMLLASSVPTCSESISSSSWYLLSNSVILPKPILRYRTFLQ